MYFLEFTKSIINLNKLEQELFALQSKYISLYSKGSYLQLKFSSSLSQEEVNAVSNLINNFVEISIVENLKEYVEKTIRPFIDNTLYQIQAENMALGITQAGKSADVLGFFMEQVTLPGKTRPVTIKGTLDTNSLNVTVELLTYYINNPSLYSDLTPFITVERLTDLRTKIIQKLG